MELQNIETVMDHVPASGAAVYTEPPMIIAGVIVLACILLALIVTFIDSRSKKKNQK